MQGSPRDFRIGPHRICPSRNVIEGPTGLLRLEPRMMRLLVRLADGAGNVVDRDRLIEEVWSGRWVTDSSLNNAIAELRKALGESAAEPRYLETVRGTGYRLVGVASMAASEPVAHRRRGSPGWSQAFRLTLAIALGFVARGVLRRTPAPPETRQGP